MNYYADKPAAMLLCACVLGSFGEVNTVLMDVRKLHHARPNDRR